MSARFASPTRAPASLLKFRTGSLIYISQPNRRARELDWQLPSGWFNFTVVQSILSVSLEEARLSGCVFRGWRTITVKRALQPRALPDSKPGFMPFSTKRPLSSTVLSVLLVLTTSSCHKKQVAVPVPSEPVPAVTAPAAEAPHQQPPAPAQPATAPATTTPAAPSTPRDDGQYQKNKPPDQPPPPKHPAHPAAPAPTAPATQSPPPAAAAPADTPR